MFRSEFFASVVIFSAAVLLASPGMGLAGSDRPKDLYGARPFNPEDETIELFTGMQSGKLEAKIIPKDATQCQLLVTNKTDKALNVHLPDVFGAVPVMAQLLDGRARDTTQGLGVGNPLGDFMNPMGRNPGMFNVGGGPGIPGFGPRPGGQRNIWAPFNVASEKVGRLKLLAVCLEHGKRDPAPHIPYQIKALSELTDKAEVHELCRMLGRGEISQPAAQAAAWHLENGLSWLALANMQHRPVLMNRRPYFSQAALAVGKQAAEVAAKRADKKGEAAKGDSLSRR